MQNVCVCIHNRAVSVSDGWEADDVSSIWVQGGILWTDGSACFQDAEAMLKREGERASSDVAHDLGLQSCRPFF